MRTARRLLTICAVGGISFIAFKGVLLAVSDARRYDRMREMSGDGPISRQFPQIFREIVAKERAMPAEFVRVIAGLPGDAARYIAIKAM